MWIAMHVDTLIDQLERAPDLVVPLVLEVPTALLKRRPAPGKWSAHEHACHLSRVDQLYSDRLELVLSNPRPVIEPYDPAYSEAEDAFLHMDLAASLERYVEQRRVLVSRLRALPAADWERTAEHAEYSHYSVFIMFRHVALHDLFHAYRIEELLLRREWTDEWQRHAISVM
jgi:hypothetical protein